MSMVKRHLRAHPRLLIAILAAAAAYPALPATVTGLTRLITVWDGGCLLFLASTWLMMGRATPERMRWRAGLQDESRWAILALTVGGACVSLLAIGFELHDIKSLTEDRLLRHIGLAAATIVLSWLLIHTTFALHYAHGYYGDHGHAAAPGQPAGGLAFPGGLDQPDYWDFLYFSLVIGMTSQVSDVAITGRAHRRLATAHGALSFFYNTVILALTINIAAGLI